MKWWAWVFLVGLTAIALYGISQRDRSCWQKGGKMVATPMGAYVCDR